MLRFIRESIKEFDHVVFPTRQETKTYFTVVVTIIVIMMIYVFAVSTLLGQGFGAIRPMTATNQSFDPSSLIDEESINAGSGLFLSGITASGAGLSGATIVEDSSVSDTPIETVMPESATGTGPAPANP
ncbi:MAG TPA: preprotein translocase subunit SecE [bacterium]|nr:preprotein translocase subunit SecE [bacterium]